MSITTAQTYEKRIRWITKLLVIWIVFYYVSRMIFPQNEAIRHATQWGYGGMVVLAVFPAILGLQTYSKITTSFFIGSTLIALLFPQLGALLIYLAFIASVYIGILVEIIAAVRRAKAALPGKKNQKTWLQACRPFYTSRVWYVAIPVFFLFVLVQFMLFDSQTGLVLSLHSFSLSQDLLGAIHEVLRAVFE